MKKKLEMMVVAVAVVAMAGILSNWRADAYAVSQKGKVERGRFLVNVGGCNDCHTPRVMGPEGPMPDMKRMLSGHPQSQKIDRQARLSGPWIAASNADLTAWSGPWGVSFAANLTPDENTGLGIWTEEMFVKAMRTGKHMGTSRPILPPMPWQNFRALGDEDLSAIYAYLRTIPAIHNRVPEPIPPTASPAGK